MNVRIKRAYDPPSTDDGVRVLVDRYWPRGVKREGAEMEAWLKEVAPSAELIKWFGHRPERWEEFKRRYYAELESKRPAELQRLRELAQASELTLVYGARDSEHNNARALADYLAGTFTESPPAPKP